MKLLKRIFCLAIAAITTQLASAQGWADKEAEPLIDLNITAGIAHGEFAHNTHSVGFGLNGGFYYPFSRKLPLYLGVNLGGMLKGSHSQHIRQDVVISAGNTVIDVIPINIDVQTNNSIWNGFVNLRYVAPIPMIKVYLEGKFGFNYLATSTTLYDRTNSGWLSSNDNDVISSDTQASSFAMAYGGEGGFMIPFNESLALKLGLSYIVGGEAEYFDETQINNWDVQYSSSGTYNPDDLNSTDFSINQDAQPRMTTTNLYMVHFGITLAL